LELGGVPDGNQHPGVGWRQLFAQHHITQVEMASRTETSPKHSNQILQGKTLPSVDLIVRMAYELDQTKLEDHDDGKGIARQMASIQSRYNLVVAFRKEEARRHASESSYSLGSESHVG
jgi:transcriptional regulator with XRE-family HTH domain